MPGLGLVPGRARRLREGRVPRMGWAEVDAPGEAFYFAHSYAAETPARDRVVGRDRRGSAARLVRRRPVPPGEERRRRRAFLEEVLMPLPRLIPCLDVAGGRVVKGVKFQGLRDVGDPVELGAAYSDAGADELVFLDIKATLDDRADAARARWAASPSGSRSRSPSAAGCARRPTARRCSAAGADKVGVNSAALARPALITELAERSASQAVVAAIDARGGECLACGHAAGRPRRGRAGRARRSSAAQARSCSRRSTPTGRARVTTSSSPGRRRRRRAPVIASGGAGNAATSPTALQVAQAALLASILHEHPQRLCPLRERGSRARGPGPMKLKAAIVQDAADRSRAHARRG